MVDFDDFMVAMDGRIHKHINHIHTAIPANVLSFDPDTCCGSVYPITKTILSDGTEIDYPEIHNVPFIFPQGNSTNAIIAFPVKEGDTCLLVFSENALDRWRGSGTLDSQLKFSLTNAVAIPGLFARPSELIKEAVNDNAVIVANGDKRVKIKENGIELDGDVTINGHLNVVGDVSSSSVTTQSITTGSCNLHDTL